MSVEVNTDEVREVNLEPMRVVCFHGFGPEPEMLAWGKLEEWTTTHGYSISDASHRIFGFNNPDPSPGSPNYGYEFWMEIGEGESVAADVQTKRFDGGAYAVLRVEVVGDAYEVIPAAWQRLHAQCEEAGLRFGSHQWLEEHITVPGAEAGFTLDLHMPIMR